MSNLNRVMFFNKIIAIFLAIFMLMLYISNFSIFYADGNTIASVDTNNTYEYETDIDVETGEKYAILTFYRGSDTDINVPTEVDGIPVRKLSETFSRFDIITVSIPDSITEISAKTFKYCRKLTTVKLPKNLIEISEELFYECSELININIPDNVRSIGKNAFYGCKNLGNRENPIILGENIDSIGDNAFQGMSQQTIIEIKNNRVRFGNDTFDKDNVIIFCSANSNSQSYCITNKIDYFNYTAGRLVIKLPDDNEYERYDPTKGLSVEPEIGVFIKNDFSQQKYEFDTTDYGIKYGENNSNGDESGSVTIIGIRNKLIGIEKTLTFRIRTKPINVDFDLKKVVGDVVGKPSEVFYNTTFVFPSIENVISDENIKFGGWCLDKDGYGAKYQGGETTRITTSTDKVIYYAYWYSDSTKFNVNYEAYGGEPIPIDRVVYYGAKLTPPEPLKKVGEIFDGWYTTPDFTGEPFDFENTSITQNVNLYAKWNNYDPKKFIPEEDFFIFLNIEQDYKNRYEVSDEAKKLLVQVAKESNGISTEDAQKFVEDIINRPWHGSCVGMATVAILIKTFQINEEFGNSKKIGLDLSQHPFNLDKYKIHDLATPKNDNEVLSLINYYQILQEVSSLFGLAVASISNDNNKAETNKVLIEKLNGKYPVLVVLKTSDDIGNVFGGHSLVAYGLENIDNRYKLTLYDPNRSEPIFATLNEDYTDLKFFDFQSVAINRYNMTDTFITGIIEGDSSYLDPFNYIEALNGNIKNPALGDGSKISDTSITINFSNFIISKFNEKNEFIESATVENGRKINGKLSISDIVSIEDGKYSKVFLPQILNGEYYKIEISEISEFIFSIGFECSEKFYRSLKGTQKIVMLYPDGEIVFVGKGDINGDGELTVTDLVQFIKCLRLQPQKYMAANDINVDGMINIIDFALLKRILLKSFLYN
ncbi:hypothetical protein FACS1894132_06170 [Clostridia bacterium]|nr:hypothetical protein FACS1894132_06170 [Clostridia bacterium]